MTIRPRRSVLYMPASNARAIEKARTLPCDGVILDLEDAVAPDAKPGARARAAAAGPDAILVPKVSAAADIAAYASAIVGAPERTMLWAMIETPAAVLALA